MGDPSLLLGKPHQVVSGIHLQTLLWTDGEAVVPTDCPVYDQADGLTRHEQCRAMLATAHARGCRDSWCSGLDNLKAIRGYGWHWLSRLKSHRLVNADRAGHVPIAKLETPSDGRVVHLTGYGMVKVFRTVATDGDVEHWATDALEMTDATRAQLETQGWGIERCQVRGSRGQQAHLGFALRACLRLEAHRLETGVSW